MSKNNKNVVIPCVIYQKKDGKCTARIPDLHIDVHATSYIEVIAEAVMLTTAIYLYRKDHGIPLAINETYEGLLKKTSREKTPHFIHTLTIEN